MTTIAYKDGVMAGDSGMTHGSRRIGTVQKVFKTAAGALWGSAGGADDRAFSNLIWDVREPGQIPTPEALAALQQDQDGLLVLPCGRVFFLQAHPPGMNAYKSGVVELLPPVGAIGSGAAFAVAAMMAGSSARQAAGIGAALDIYSAPPITSVSLDSASSQVLAFPRHEAKSLT